MNQALQTNRYRTDCLVIGSGLAGLSAALKAAEDRDVLIITKRVADECNTAYAQGGIACVIAEGDSFESHIQDTLEAGAGLCDAEAVRRIVEAGPARVADLMDLGIHFTRQSEIVTTDPDTDQFHLGREGGHSNRRVLHAGDITGREIVKVLLEHCRRNPRITILENHLAVDLISTRETVWQGENRCLGCYVLDRGTNRIHTVLSPHTVLATGGAGKVYLYTSNPDVASGDGVAMAYRAYAEIANMEFFQFHPTCLYHPKAKNFLVSEAVRGEGAALKIQKGDEYVEFMHKYHPKGALAPRDVVAHAIDNELKRTGLPCVYLDIRHHDEAFLRRRFPNIYAKLQSLGIDMARDLIPVVPAAHYCCGGVRTDTDGRTTVHGLYAVGEVACTGLHGANRLASNSLLEAIVVAHNAVTHARRSGDQAARAVAQATVPDWSSGDAVDSDEQIVISHTWEEIRRFMWDYVGIFRTNKRLERAKNRVRLLRNEIEKYYWDFIVTPDLVELRNLASVAEMIIDCAMARRESRGLHFNTDYPVSDPEVPGRNTIIRRPTRAVIWSE